MLLFYLPIIIFEAMLEANANKRNADSSGLPACASFPYGGDRSWRSAYPRRHARSTASNGIKSERFG